MEMKKKIIKNNNLKDPKKTKTAAKTKPTIRISFILEKVISAVPVMKKT